jgi:hypothetical protein
MVRLRTWLVLAGLSLVAAPFLLRGQTPHPGQLPPAAAPADAAPAPETRPPEGAPLGLDKQTDEQALTKSSGCLTCHAGIEPMHESKNVRLGCVDCHGGNACATTKEAAHVHPRFPEKWPTSANPQRTYALLNLESPEFVRFINPGDMRCWDKSCGTAGCHPEECAHNRKSLMGHSAMVPGSGLYNNGIAPMKNYAFGEVYGWGGVALKIWSYPRATDEDTKVRGILGSIGPLPRFEIIPPGNIFRILEINNDATSARGVGTDFRVDAGGIAVHKTKLNDPTMVFLGTNDHAGDYRSSGCTSCHVPYANDRDPAHSAWSAPYGNRGYYAGNDPTLPKNESGHPIKHQLTRAIPSTQCVSCHFHQGSGALANYYGYMWWDYESDAEKIYPITGKPGLNGSVGYVSPIGPAIPALSAKYETHDLAQQVNPLMFGNKLADFHNAGWLMQAVYKRDLHGNLLDDNDQIIPEGSADWHKRAVHLSDIHMDKGMHCVDCHFKADNHGNGRIYGAMIDAIEISCKDCHGTVTDYATFTTSNRAGPNDLKLTRTSFGQRRFYQMDGKWYQRSSVTKDLSWPLKQVKDVITPGSPDFNEKAMYAKTIRKDNKTWGPLNGEKDTCQLAHTEGKMTCYACHSSWNTQCSGCHLDGRTNLNTPTLHYEDGYTKFFISYNPDVLRSDGFMLGINGTVQGHKVSPVRSASGVIASARDGNRAIVAHQQPTISAEGFSGMAFTPNPPHTVRVKETKKCSECHVSVSDDNNAVVGKVVGLGAHSVDIVGRYVYVAERTKGFEAHRVTCEEEFPEPLIGSDTHRLINPASYAKHVAHGGVVDYKNLGLAKEKRCPDSPDDPDGWVHRHLTCDCRSLQRYGEFLLIADGAGGLRGFDIANVANKNLAQRIVESPLSPLGQNLRVHSRCANYVAVPTTMPMDTCRSHMADNEEQVVHPLFSYCYVADGYEGMIVVNIHTLVDSNPSNNFFERTTTFNPDGILNGAVYIKIAGHYAYVLCDKGMVVVDIENPKCPKVCGILGGSAFVKPRSMDIQFRYAFVCDCEGLKVVDITHPCDPQMRTVVKMHDARDVKVMRTYAYVAAGADGLGIVDVEAPTRPGVPQYFTANGCINDATGVVVGASLMSLYVYLADGKNGLRTINVASPVNGSDVKGFSPVPRPCLIATFPTKGCAVALSEGIPRDRYVDESGNQIGVLGRRGSRPFNREELEGMYLLHGNLFMVSDKPTTPPVGVRH